MDELLISASLIIHNYQHIPLSNIVVFHLIFYIKFKVYKSWDLFVKMLHFHKAFFEMDGFSAY